MNAVHVIPNLSEIEAIGELKNEYGLHYEFNEFFSPSVLDDPKKQSEIIEAYSRICGDFSQDTLHGAFLDVTVHSSDALIRQVSERRVLQSMDIAKEMGAKGVVFHTGLIGGFHLDYYVSQWLKLNREFFTRTAEAYPDIEIYMENMFDDTPELLAALAEQMKDVPNFGVCYDFAHGNLTKVPAAEWFETLAPGIRHMHINDNDLVNDLHLPVGAGRTDWEQFGALLEKYDYKGSILIEVKGYEAIKASLEFMQKQKWGKICS